MNSSRPLPTQIGRYQVVRLIGVGAMGRVLLAHDPILDRDVAVKLLRDDLGLTEDQQRTLLDRMRQEARAAARVSHPNIVALHDMGEDPNVGLFLVFEYLDGDTLKDRLLRSPLGPVAVAQLAQGLGNALMTAHSSGVLHRDIKPENIILTKNGPKIADFGIARVPDSTLTFGGGLLGTPAYSAPEAISEGQFSPQSDQFSLAATLYEALSGQRAFPGDDAVAVASRITTEDPPRLAAAAGVDPHVDVILARALSKQPRARFETCEEFGRALSESLEVAPRSMMRTEPDQVHREAAHEAIRPKLIRSALGGAALGTLATITAFQLTVGLRHEEKPAEMRVETVAPPPTAETEAMPVAWLAERPPEPKSKRVNDRQTTAEGSRRNGDPESATRRKASSKRDGGAASDAGAKPRDAGRARKN